MVEVEEWLQNSSASLHLRLDYLNGTLLLCWSGRGRGGSGVVGVNVKIKFNAYL